MPKRNQKKARSRKSKEQPKYITRSCTQLPPTQLWQHEEIYATVVLSFHAMVQLVYDPSKWRYPPTSTVHQLSDDSNEDFSTKNDQQPKTKTTTNIATNELAQC